MYDIYGRNELDEWLIKNSLEGKVMVLYFGTPWCGPCKALKSRLSKQTEMPLIEVGYLNAEDITNVKIATKYNINAFPTLIFVKLEKSKVVETGRIVGYDWIKTIAEYNNYNL